MKVLALLVAAAFVLLSFQRGQADERERLLTKGFSEQILEKLNPLCLRALNRRVPSGVLWFATLDGVTGTLTVDFQTPDRVHHSLLFASVGKERCHVYHVASYLVDRDLGTELKSWLDTFKQRRIEVEILEETPQRVFIGGTGNSGMKLFLYSMGRYTMGVWRNFQALTEGQPP